MIEAVTTRVFGRIRATFSVFRVSWKSDSWSRSRCVPGSGVGRVPRDAAQPDGDLTAVDGRLERARVDARVPRRDDAHRRRQPPGRLRVSIRARAAACCRRPSTGTGSVPAFARAVLSNTTW